MRGSAIDPPEWLPMTHVESLPIVGGRAQFRIRLRNDRAMLLEVMFAAGVRSPAHSHQHDSYLYLLSGHLGGSLDGRTAELRPGQTLLHPAGVHHVVEAIAESRWLEFKSPPHITIH